MFYRNKSTDRIIYHYLIGKCEQCCGGGERSDEIFTEERPDRRGVGGENVNWSEIIKTRPIKRDGWRGGE